MEKTWLILIGILLFTIVTFLYWKLTKGYVKKTHGEKMWKQWGTQTFYWSGTFFFCGGITVALLFLFK